MKQNMPSGNVFHPEMYYLNKKYILDLKMHYELWKSIF